MCMECRWYHLTTDEFSGGEQEIVVASRLADLPVFARAGSIIPMQSVIRNTSEKPDETLILQVYAGKGASAFTYYEDDGVSYAFEKGAFFKRVLKYDPVKRQIEFTAREGSYASKFSKVRLVLHGFPALAGMKVNGTPATITRDSEKIQSVTLPWNERETIILLNN